MKVQSAKKNYIYNLIYQILLIIIPLITTPYISRVLMPEGVGKSGFVNSIIAYFVLFANFGYGYYAQRIMAKDRDDKYQQSKIFYEILLSRAVFVFISIGLNLILVFAGAYGDNSSLMLISTISIFSVLIDVSFFFQGNEDFFTLIVKNLLIRVLGVVAIFLFVKTKNDLPIYVLIGSLTGFLGGISLWISLRGKICKVKIKDLHPMKHILPSFKLFLPAIATSIYTVLDKSLIGIITSDDAQTGFYEQAEKIVKITMTIVTSLSTVMIARNSHSIAKQNYDEVKSNCYKSIHFIWLLGIPVMFGICMIASNLVPWFLGDGYNEVVGLIFILSFLNLAIGISSVLGLQYIIPMGKDKLFTISLSCGSLINLALNIPLIIFFGSVGAAIATIIAETMVSLIMLISLRKDLSIKDLFKTMLKPLIAGVVMILATLPIVLKLGSSIINTFIIVVVGVFSYCLCILCLKDSLVLEFIKLLKNKLFKRKENAYINDEIEAADSSKSDEN